MSRFDPTALQNSVKPRDSRRRLDGGRSLRPDDARRPPCAARRRARGGRRFGRRPGPYELLLMALGSCTSMTVHLYAARKKWPLEQVVVRLRQERVHVQNCTDCEKPDAMVHRIEKTIELIGTLDGEQRQRLREIADHCPVHKTLTSKIVIETVLG